MGMFNQGQGTTPLGGLFGGMQAGLQAAQRRQRMDLTQQRAGQTALNAEATQARSDRTFAETQKKNRAAAEADLESTFYNVTPDKIASFVRSIDRFRRDWGADAISGEDIANMQQTLGLNEDWSRNGIFAGFGPDQKAGAHEWLKTTQPGAYSDVMAGVLETVNGLDPAIFEDTAALDQIHDQAYAKMKETAESAGHDPNVINDMMTTWDEQWNGHVKRHQETAKRTAGLYENKRQMREEVLADFDRILGPSVKGSATAGEISLGGMGSVPSSAIDPDRAPAWRMLRLIADGMLAEADRSGKPLPTGDQLAEMVFAETKGNDDYIFDDVHVLDRSKPSVADVSGAKVDLGNGKTMEWVEAKDSWVVFDDIAEVATLATQEDLQKLPPYYRNVGRDMER